jgi:hypothetical protein
MSEAKVKFTKNLGSDLLQQRMRKVRMGEKKNPHTVCKLHLARKYDLVIGNKAGKQKSSLKIVVCIDLEANNLFENISFFFWRKGLSYSRI